MLRIACSPFFHPKYLRGKYFDRSIVGWKWVWRSLWTQKLLGYNRNVPWPVSPFITIINATNLKFDVDDMNNFQMFGNYFQNFSGTIHVGKGCWIARNVGIITANHDPENPDRHLPGADVVLGKGCWIGMNSVLLPGVQLGDHTVVGAGSIVTKSFPEGHCVIGGNPAKLIRRMNSEETAGDRTAAEDATDGDVSRS
ncbi:MAG: acyltransferase [Planctomycetales bacterium]